MSREPAGRPRLVLKFGGTSLGDPGRIEAAASLVQSHLEGAQVVLVVSAMAKVTDSLLKAAGAASRGETGVWSELGDSLLAMHRKVCERLLEGQERTRAEAVVTSTLASFRDFCRGYSLVQETTPRSLDSLSSMGELLSATLVAAVLRSRGIAARALDAAQLIVSDDRAGNASPLLAETRERVLARLPPLLEGGEVPVVTGFRAGTREGVCTTLGRGGSDYSATILGALLPAERILIWTDVDGILTADPQLVESAHVIPELSYQEARELAFFGAKVIHPKAIELPMRYQLPVWIKNTFAPDRPGTKISVSRARRPGVRAIAHTSDARLLTVSGAPETSFNRLAAAIFGLLETERVATLMVTQSSAENVICLAVAGRDGARVQRRLEHEIQRGALILGAVESAPPVGIVVAVGEAMRGTPGIAARLFGALGADGINVMAISQGSSELSVSAAVSAGDLPAAVRAIHAEFAL